MRLGLLGKWLAALLLTSLGACLGGSACGLLLARFVYQAHPSQGAAYFDGTPAVLNIAHRGASVLEREHSLDAYRLALSQGADVLELDVRRTRDGATVIVHDEDLGRVAGVETAVSAMSLDELRVAAGGRAPLALDQVFTEFSRSRFNIELKDNDRRLGNAVCTDIRKHGVTERAVVASFHSDVLESFRDVCAGVATSASARESLGAYVCYLTGVGCNMPYAALQLPADSPLDLTDAAFVRFAHEQGLRVHYWTVDEPGTMRRLIKAGADGIMTNRPDRLRAVLDSTP